MNDEWADGADITVTGEPSGKRDDTDFAVVTFDNQNGALFHIEVSPAELRRIIDDMEDFYYTIID